MSTVTGGNSPQTACLLNMGSQAWPEMKGRQQRRPLWNRKTCSVAMVSPTVMMSSASIPSAAAIQRAIAPIQFESASRTSRIASASLRPERAGTWKE
jgi:hypothetical protein